MSNKTLAIVVTYNGEEWIEYCFNSLMLSDIPIDIICIDNNSSDNSVAIIRNKFPTVELIVSKENLGFGKANNIGLAKCISQDYDYAFLLNQDARIEENTISQLINIQKNNKDYGILSPIHRSFDNSKLDYNFSLYLRSNNTKHIISDYILNQNIKELYETDFVNAAIWLISKECLQQVKSFNPIFPHYGEDDEFIFRAKRLNFKIGIVPSALANHARYKVKGIQKKEDFNSYINRKYITLLIKYEKHQAPSKEKISFFFRKFISALFDDFIMLDFQSFKNNCIIYVRLFKETIRFSI